MVSEPTRLHAPSRVTSPRVTRPRETTPRFTSQQFAVSAPPSVHPGVSRVAIWLALGLCGWAIVASVIVTGFRIFV